MGKDLKKYPKSSRRENSDKESVLDTSIDTICAKPMRGIIAEARRHK
jgi:hypothetical protein